MLLGLCRYIREWIAEFELAAKETQEGSTTGTDIGNTGGRVMEAAYPLGLSRCGVCGAVLVRMKHCTHDGRVSPAQNNVWRAKHRAQCPCALLQRLIRCAWDCLQASPLAMRGHLSGKRHTRAVARRFYVTSRRAGVEPEPPLHAGARVASVADTTRERGEDLSEGSASNSVLERARGNETAVRELRRHRLFEEYSSEPLRRNGWAEAPDIALVLLHEALDNT